MDSTEAGIAIRTLRFLFRHWAVIVACVLVVMAAITGYQIWRMGFQEALALGAVDTLIIYLALAAVVVVMRYGIIPYAITVYHNSRARAKVQKRVAREAVEQGRSQAKEIVQKRVQTAEGTFNRVSKRAKREWDSVRRREPDSGSMVTPATRPCPHCGHVMRDGAKFCERCGSHLGSACANCGRSLRPGTKFCDRCGTAVQ